MKADDLKFRTKEFALRIMKVVDALPKTANGRAIANQISRSGTSVAANYRAALRARSDSEFLAKIGIVVEEVDETLLWLEIVAEYNLLKKALLKSIINEANELTAIFCSTYKKSKQTKSKFINHTS